MNDKTLRRFFLVLAGTSVLSCLLFALWVAAYLERQQRRDPAQMLFEAIEDWAIEQATADAIWNATWEAERPTREAIDATQEAVAATELARWWATLEADAATQEAQIQESNATLEAQWQAEEQEWMTLEAQWQAEEQEWMTLEAQWQIED